MFRTEKIGAAYHNTNITIIGTGSGLSYAELGPTHHSLEDIGIISSIPNMRVLANCDSIELENQIREIINLDGPSYIRIIFQKENQICLIINKVTKIGKAEIIRDGRD